MYSGITVWLINGILTVGWYSYIKICDWLEINKHLVILIKANFDSLHFSNLNITCLFHWITFNIIQCTKLNIVSTSLNVNDENQLNSHLVLLSYRKLFDFSRRLMLIFPPFYYYHMNFFVLCYYQLFLSFLFNVFVWIL